MGGGGGFYLPLKILTLVGVVRAPSAKKTESSSKIYFSQDKNKKPAIKAVPAKVVTPAAKKAESSSDSSSKDKDDKTAVKATS